MLLFAIGSEYALSSLRAVARGTVHLSLYPTPKTGFAAKQKLTNICRQKSALERACFA
jgi:hypothetical protein